MFETVVKYLKTSVTATVATGAVVPDAVITGTVITGTITVIIVAAHRPFSVVEGVKVLVDFSCNCRWTTVLSLCTKYNRGTTSETIVQRELA